jgi:phospholipid/cholesterol/gamma-HCH transport system substrate-binding protein
MDTSRITREPFHRKHRNLFVGLFIVVPIIVVPFFLLYTFFKTELFEKWDYLNVVYENAGGLSINTPVTILGMKVGYVENVSLNPLGYVDVKLKIRRKYMQYIKKDSRARLQQKNIAIGDWEIDITLSNSLAPIVSDGDTLLSEVQSPLAKTLDQVTKTVEVLQNILTDISQGKGTFGRIIKEDTLLNMLYGIGKKANALVAHTNSTIIKVDSVLNKLTQVGESGKNFIDSLGQISPKLGNLISDVNLLVTNVQTMSEDVPGLINRVQSDILEVELLLKALQNNFIIKSGITSQKDPLLDDNPLK